jgi:hypothetical protein
MVNSLTAAANTPISGAALQTHVWDGLTGKKKCTFMLKVAGGEMAAPGFDLVHADFVKFQLQWSEWDTAAMGTSGFL